LVELALEIEVFLKALLDTAFFLGFEVHLVVALDAAVGAIGH
jgi:hypothetical protein